uniref:Uncharacterized protein n=1 Tax=Oryza brachyantha TaxID=4533 RepID=J3LAZ3_ORYBR
MEPSPRNISNLLNHQNSPTQHSEGIGQISPPTPQSQFPFGTSQPFWSSEHPPPYGHSPPRFQSVQQQGVLQASPPPNFQGFHLHESVGPLGAPAARTPSLMLHFSYLGGVTPNTSSHRSESNSRCSAQQEKQSVNIEELSDSSEEKPKRRHIN